MRIDRLDGIRGIAVLFVVLHHHKMFANGWIGVDLFFVLSGFLITGILRNARSDRSYWGPFYLKRATRILPPLVILIPIALIISRHVSLLTALGYLFFAGNVVNVTKHSSTLLGITWSLAIEEHFYLIWPFAVRYLRRENLIRLLACVLIAEPLLRAILSAHFSTMEPIYYLTPFRLDGLAAGSLLAVSIESPKAAEAWKKWSFAALPLSLVAFITLSITLSNTFNRDANTVLFNSLGYSLMALLSLSFVTYVYLNQDSIVSRLLASRALVFVGTISYGIYLFHPTVLAIAERLAGVHTFPVDPVMAHKLFWFDLPATLLIAWVSFRLYEKPITLWGRRKAAELRLKDERLIDVVPGTLEALDGATAKTS
jgi:peptidoglycan/LPS O-acetylase OafA/YrhL